jgi:hypothetical protein
MPPSLGKTPSQSKRLAVAILITLQSLWHDSLTYSIERGRFMLYNGNTNQRRTHHDTL